MSDRVIYSVYPESYSDSEQYRQLTALFEATDFEQDELAVVPRGGDILFTPPLAIALAFIGGAYASGLIGAIASDHYNAVKALLKKAFKIAPPRGSDWPSSEPTPTLLRLTMQMETADHSYIIDFDTAEYESINAALEQLPSFIAALNTNGNPTHHLLLWNGEMWTVSASYDWKRTS